MIIGCCAKPEQIEAVKRLGFDFVELALAPIMELSEEAFEQGPRKSLAEASIICPRMNVFLPGSLRLTGPEADHEAAMLYAARAFNRAKALGASCIVLGSGGARNLPLHVAREEGMAQMAAFLEKLAPLADEAGLVIAIEHLNRLESNIINSLIEGLDLVLQVNHPAIRLLADSFHMNMVNEPLENLLDAGAMLEHVHIARTLGRGYPRRGDEEDYPGLISLLRQAAYDGTISLECSVKEDFEQEAAEALALLREAM